MASSTASGAETLVNGAAHDHILRPRPWKQHSLLGKNGPLQEGVASETPNRSGASTPVPENAPPSIQSLHSARKQVRAERRRLFPTVDYTWRLSHFDPNSDYSDFHGFYSLFWIGLGIMALTTMVRNIKDTGYPFRVRIWALFATKPLHLAVADFFMVASTSVALPLHRVWRSVGPQSRWTWRRGGMALQSTYQLVWMAFWTAVPFVFDWTWTAQVFFLLHSMVMLMKMHSYVFYNGHLSEIEKRLKELDDPRCKRRGPVEPYPSAEEPPEEEGGSVPSSPPKQAGKKNKKKKNKCSAKKAEPQQQQQQQQQEREKESGRDEDTHSSSDEIDQLREDLARELTSPLGNVTYPRNLTWYNYLDYLACPTLCYELEYPRTKSIDWYQFGSKVAATFGCIFLLTIVSEDFILPVLTDANNRLNPPPEGQQLSASETVLVLSETVSWLLFPFMVTFLLVFLVIFEYVLGAAAEITRFADRHFYSDWWNSTDWMEFSREWNVPVHAFLRRHVYSASRPHIGKNMATLITFLVSAVGHEIVMACITKKLRGYGFICQMLQLPIVMLQRTRWVRGRETLNNCMFWCSMILGLSTICSLYVLV